MWISGSSQVWQKVARFWRAVAVEKQFVLNHLEHVRGKAFPIGELVFRHRLGEVPAREDRIHERIADVISIG